MEGIIYKCRLWTRFIKSTISRLNRYAKREFMLYYVEPTEHFQYYMRVTYHATRQVHETRFNSMKEIVEYVYYNIPNSDTYTYTLVCRNMVSNKEYSILLRHNKSKPSKKLAL